MFFQCKILILQCNQVELYSFQCLNVLKHAIFLDQIRSQLNIVNKKHTLQQFFLSVSAIRTEIGKANIRFSKNFFLVWKNLISSIFFTIVVTYDISLIFFGAAKSINTSYNSRYKVFSIFNWILILFFHLLFLKLCFLENCLFYG